MKDKILEALSQLDPLNDDHWTTDGAPRMDAIEAIVGDKSITRKDIVNAAPDFNREKASQPPEDDEQSGDQGEAQENQTNGEGSQEQQPNPDDDEDEDEDEPQGELEIPTGQTEAEFIQWMLTLKANDLESLEETLKEQINQLAQGIEQAKDLIIKTRRAVTATRQRIQQIVPGSTNQDAINDFIKAQNAALAAKVARRNEILKGVKADELDPRAPIDAAMARKTKRGTQRPTRPIMK